MDYNLCCHVFPQIVERMSSNQETVQFPYLHDLNVQLPNERMSITYK